MAVQAQSGWRVTQAKLEISIEREMSMTGFNAEPTRTRTTVRETYGKVTIEGRGLLITL
jgi:hypothetical protein